ncbi:MAG: hypothetical protein P8180_17695 [Gammaproteobacteria bacterium]
MTDFRARLTRLVRLAAPGPGCARPLWLAVPEAAGLRAALKAQRYYRLADGLAALRERDVVAWALAVEALADWPEPMRELDWWVWEADHLGEPRLARGIHTVRNLGGGNGLGTAPLSVPGLARFFRQVERAERDLAAAAERLPQSAEPWSWLLCSGLFAGLDDGVLAARFAAAVEREPGHLPAHVQRVRSLAGDECGCDEALAFARSVAGASPRGSVLHGLVAQAWIERWAWQLYTDGPASARATLVAPTVVAEVRAAFAASLGSARYRPGARAALPAGFFAMVFHLQDDREGALQATEQMAGLACRYPWSYLPWIGAQHGCDAGLPAWIRAALGRARVADPDRC